MIKNKACGVRILRICQIMTLTILLFVVVAGAAPFEVWNKTFGENYKFGRAFSVQETSDGGFILAGTMEHEAWLIKTDSSGIEQWNKTFGGTRYEQIFYVRQTFDDGYILTGSTSPISSGDIKFNNALLMKTDSNGNLQWSKKFGGEGDFITYCVQQISDGGYILAGEERLGYKNNLVLFIKTDAKGNEIWRKEFGGAAQGFNDSFIGNARFVRQTSDRGYILVGSIAEPSSGSLGASGMGFSDMWIIKTDLDGNVQWNRRFGGTGGNNRAYSVDLTQDNGYILAGTTWRNGINAWVIKIDSSGNEIWNKKFGGRWSDGRIRSDAVYSVKQTSDGGYILAGDAADINHGDAWLIKIDSRGDEQWNMTFDAPDTEKAWSVQQTSDGGYIMVGEKRISSGIGQGEKAILIKVSGDPSYVPSISGMTPKSSGFELLLGIFATIIAFVLTFWRLRI